MYKACKEGDLLLYLSTLVLGGCTLEKPTVHAQPPKHPLVERHNGAASLAVQGNLRQAKNLRPQTCNLRGGRRGYKRGCSGHVA